VTFFFEAQRLSPLDSARMAEGNNDDYEIHSPHKTRPAL
jgi:hypothetical protein